MKNQKFQTLLEHAWSTLGEPREALKEKYKDYPLCLIEYIEREAHEHVIKIRFDMEEATIYVSLNSESKGETSSLFFDSPEDEDLLVEHLINWADYNFKKGSFELPSCLLKVKETKRETYFYLFR